ncbi:MAG: glycosyltransferase [Candidatus Cloacimonetes bacterium]|nr:glycosyltransferase [Candidatus Cloacimonadota bacterium]
MPNNIHCSIGVIVYNEAANIGRLLRALHSQRLRTVVIDRIFVVSSACTDGTDDIVLEYAVMHPDVTLIAQSERRGKSSAINLFLEAADSEALIIESGDTLPAKDTVEKLVSAFADSNVGMTGGRPLPENPSGTFIGYAVNLLWKLHHRMALISPKLGEMVAFRNVIDSIPADSAVDEASIEKIITDRGLKLRYIPGAIVHNKGPETVRDFISQRRRIATGHQWLAAGHHYVVPSQKPSILLRITAVEALRSPARLPWLLGVIGLELYCRALGWYDFKVRKKNPFAWDIAASTKKLEIDT